jgi:hypothetical protein
MVSKTVYYSKVNLNSQEAYELVKNYELRYTITNDILQMLKHDYIFEDTYTYFSEDGEQKEGKIVYSLSIDRKDDMSIEGTLYRKSMIFTKRRDEQTGEMKSYPVENTEDIAFYYDVLHEFIAFISRRRFGRKMFNKAFEKMLNKCSEESEYGYCFYIETFNAGLTINQIKDKIKEEREIKELTITYRPVNPDEGIISTAKKASEKEKLEESHATERTVIYKAKGKEFIYGGAKIIQDDLDYIVNINEDMPILDMTQRGYVVVTSKNKQGDVTTTADSKPFVKMVNEMSDFIETARNGISEILRKAVKSDTEI